MTSMHTSMPAARCAALLVAAGRGERFGAGTPKQFLSLGGRPLYEHAARVLHESPVIDSLYVVAPPGWEEKLGAGLLAAGLGTKLRAVVPGGTTRQESVWLGLQALVGGTHVLVHDAARPFPTERLVRETAAAAWRSGAATVGLPISDTLLCVEASAPWREDESPGEPELESWGVAAAAKPRLRAAGKLSRDGVWSVQTPQAFALELLHAAHRHGRGRAALATDDAGLVLDLGHAVEVVPGNWWNLKVTRAADLRRAELLLQMRERLLAEEGA